MLSGPSLIGPNTTPICAKYMPRVSQRTPPFENACTIAPSAGDAGHRSGCEVRLKISSQRAEIAGVEESARSLGSRASSTACQDALTRGPEQVSSPQSPYHSSTARVSAKGASRRVSKTLMPSANMAGLAVNAGAAIPVRVMAVYVRFDTDSLAGGSRSGDSTLSMATRLVPLSMLSFRPVIDDEL